jgi:hypothetical protein
MDMKKLLAILLLSLSTSTAHAQGVDGTEFGLDGTFWASFGQIRSGTIGFGMKYGLKFGENVILGPSVRYQRYWTNNTLTGTSGGNNVYGGGAFIHGRFSNVIFVGAEVEALRSPFTNNGLLTNSSKWVGTCLIGGGFSREFNESFRLNAGVFYDILDVPNPANPNNPNPNSPLQPYLTKKPNGQVIPIIYRIALFIPLS